ncbi:MAG: AAA family ATPase [Mucilaginibacter sp.]|uniref:AAA family ATPase n=1 Tax=Mucilaginibacter sp. TaxID=1882438 RepID=UPI0031AD2B73
MSNTPFYRPLAIEMIRTDVQDIKARQAKAGKAHEIPMGDAGADLFNIQTANQWMHIEKQKPNPGMLFGNFWYQNELCILFADTNMGKSILAVQLGDSISKGVAIGPFEMYAPAQTVLYIDFELSAKQFELRYSDTHGSYEFSPEFFRAEFTMQHEVPYQYKDFNDYLHSALNYAITHTGAQVLIIDNITCLRNGTERADNAISLMRHLNALKARHQLSILVLAHTPKRQIANPITRNDLQGSKMLINFADSAFAIGECCQTQPDAGDTPAAPYRYLKQVKQRNGTEVYGAQNVCLFKLIRSDSFLQFEFAGHAHEYDLLRRYSQQQHHHYAQQVALLLTDGKSQRQIADKLHISLGLVNKLAQQHKLLIAV